MSTTFSRTLRSLHADNFRGSSWLVLLGLLALILWFGWFFLAQILIYENSQEASVMPTGQAVALFPLSAAGRIHSGQSARMQLENLSNDRFGSVPARVIQTTQTLQGLQVSLDLQPVSGSPFQLQPGMKGSVKIEVEQVSPAALVLRAIGQSGSTGQLIFSPLPNNP
jgi:hypothetical protein